MDFSNIAHFLEHWIHTHPQWLFLFIMLVSAVESLAIIGAIIPGIVLLFGAGTLVGKGFLSLKAALMAAWIGAFIGDTLSFFAGQFFHMHIREWGIFKRHKNWLDKGENFFLQHGSLSVFIGRFAGPIRAVLPLIAGMMGMPIIRFIIIDIIAGILWAAAYLIPGYLVGASMHWTEFVSKEFVITIAILAIVSWGISFLFAQYLARKKESFSLGGWLVMTLAMIFCIWAGLNAAGLLTPLNKAVALNVVHGETLISDKIAVAITILGSNTVQLFWAIILFLTFWLWGNKKSALTFSFTMVGLVIILSLVKWGLNTQRPPNMVNLVNYSFPSGHATLTSFLALIAGQRLGSALKLPLRFTVWGLAIFSSAMVALSRIYLNVHWFADIVGALLLGATAFTFWLYIEDSTYRPIPVRHPTILFSALVVVTAVLTTMLYPSMALKYIGP